MDYPAKDAKHIIKPACVRDWHIPKGLPNVASISVDFGHPYSKKNLRKEVKIVSVALFPDGA